MSQKDVHAGADFAEAAISALCHTGTGEEPLHFYVGMIGAHMGNIVAHVGKDAALAILDVVREQINGSPLDKKQVATH